MDVFNSRLIPPEKSSDVTVTSSGVPGRVRRKSSGVEGCVQFLSQLLTSAVVSGKQHAQHINERRGSVLEIELMCSSS